MGDKRVQIILAAADQTSGPLASARRGMDGFSSSTTLASHAARSLTAALGPIAIALAALQTLRAVATGVFETAKEFEALNASLITVTGSERAASAAFANLQTFAAETPYQIQEVVQAFIKLRALGLDPSNESLRSYGNTASAMGKSLNQVIEAVADAATGEFERLKEFGIKSKSEGDKVTFTFRGVATTVAKEAGAIEEYLRRIGEVEFAGGMARQMDTLGGGLSNLGDSWSRFLDALGDTGIIDAAKAAVNGMSSALRDMTTVLDLLNAYRQNKISFWEFLTADDKDAKVLLERAAKIDTTLAGLDQRVKELKARKQGNFWWTAHEEADLQQAMAAADTYRIKIEALAAANDVATDSWLARAQGEAAAAARAAAMPPPKKDKEVGAVADYGAGLWEAQAAARFEINSRAQDLELAREKEAAAQKAAVWTYGDDLWLYSHEHRYEIASRTTQAILDNEAAAEAKRQTANQLALQQYGQLQQGIYAVAQKSGGRMMKLYQATTLPITLANAYKAASGAFADTQGPLYLRAAAYGAALGLGLQAYSTIQGLVGGGGGSGGGPGYGGGTPSSPVVTQPMSNQQQTPQSLTIVIQGNVIGQERWVEEQLAPTIRELSGRNVNFGFTTARD